MSSIILPEKPLILEWRCEPIVLKLMEDQRWPKTYAQRWFSDFMCWLYSAQKWKSQKNSGFIMDGLHYLDDVWHTYILHTKQYMEMCNTLFKTDYLHHTPSPAFQKEILDPEIFKQQLLFLLDDWGEEYIDRVWAYGADLSDILKEKHVIPVT